MGGGSLTEFVLDTSVAAAWFFADEITEQTDQLRERAVKYGIVVPALWFFEIGNAFRMGEKRKRILIDDIGLHINFIKALRITTDDKPLANVVADLLLLSKAHDLTVYDAAYLELALRCGLPLATKDNALRQAAQPLSIKILPE